MEDLFKKFVYTGVGWISITAEKFKKTIDEFVKEGKLSAKDGKKIVDDFMKSTEPKREELEKEFKIVIDNIIKKFSFVRKTEAEELEKRIVKLEKLLNQKTKEKKAPKAKKATTDTKKTTSTAKKTATGKKSTTKSASKKSTGSKGTKK